MLPVALSSAKDYRGILYVCLIMVRAIRTVFCWKGNFLETHEFKKKKNQYFGRTIGTNTPLSHHRLQKTSDRTSIRGSLGTFDENTVVDKNGTWQQRTKRPRRPAAAAGETRLSNRSVCTFFVFVFPLDDHHRRQTWRFYYRKIFTFPYTARPTHVHARTVECCCRRSPHFRRRSENVGPAFAAHRCACVPLRVLIAATTATTTTRRRRRRRYKSNGTAVKDDDNDDDRPGKKNSQLKKKKTKSIERRPYRNRSAG